MPTYVLRRCDVLQPVSLHDIELVELSAGVRKSIDIAEAMPVCSLLILLAVTLACVLTGQFLLVIEGQTSIRIAALLAAIGLLQVLVLRFVIMPVRIGMMRRASTLLAEHVSREKVRKRMLRSWWGPRPGALSLTEAGELLLIDSSTGYRLQRIVAHDIRMLRLVVVDRSCPDHTARQLLLEAGFRGMGRRRWSSRPASMSGAFLEIRYRAGEDNDDGFVLVPFGPDERSARVLGQTLHPGTFDPTPGDL